MSRAALFAVLCAALLLAACRQHDRVVASAAAGGPAAAASRGAAATAARARFVPPAESSLANDAFGREVRLGRDIFTDTARYAPAYVGNRLNCENCHLDAGRLADAGPLWGAWPMYPAYRAKNGHVNSFAERLQGCFRYSMNGKPPPADDPVIVALETYAYWLSRGAPVGRALPGRGYPRLPRPTLAPDYARGAQVYQRDCVLCHGADGQGQQVAGRSVFPPLWGPDSFNWGAGMHEVDKAAGFIRANMPLGRGNTLSIQDAWDVAYFMDAHERPQDPRYTGSIPATRARYHDTPESLYGIVVNGHLLGVGSVKQ